MKINGKTVKENESWKCPSCGEMILFYEGSGFPALSRRDNKTDICSRCGENEAMRDYFGRREN